MHALQKIVSVQVTGPTSIRVAFSDGLVRNIDLAPIMRGALYGPLRDPVLFNQVSVDPEVRTVVWPNGADFDPAILHDWPEHVAAFTAMAARWELPSDSPPPSRP